MNKIYKLKFAKATNSLVAVSELATNAVAEQNVSSGEASNQAHQLEANQLTNSLYNAVFNDVKTTNTAVNNKTSSVTSSLLTTSVKSGAMIAATALAAGMSQQAMAAPSGASIVSGNVDISQSGLVTTIKNSPNAIINWQQFNIGKDEVVRFIQQNAQSAVLNRVVGGSISKILGTLQSNGKVFLVNPNGIIFGKGATVDVHSMIASTLDITDENFKKGNYVFDQKKDSALANVVNQGMIKVNDDGTLALIGGNVANQGKLEARNGSVYLLAGNSIEFTDLENPNVSYKVKATNKASSGGR